MVDTELSVEDDIYSSYLRLCYWFLAQMYLVACLVIVAGVCTLPYPALAVAPPSAAARLPEFDGASFLELQRLLTTPIGGLLQ